MDVFKKFCSMSFKKHLIFGLAIRLILTIYGEIHDRTQLVSFTDIDYNVYSDAARIVIDGLSPYKRQTYRYSPIIAYLMIPNILFFSVFGKVLFSVCDILVALAIKRTIALQMKSETKIKSSVTIAKVSSLSTLLWIYNPISIVISARGNADSISSLLITLSILFIQKNATKGKLQYVLSGVFLALSVHLRLYPIVFSFPMYLSIGDFKITRKTSIKDSFLAFLPNQKQLLLAGSCVLTLVIFTWSFYDLYGYEFLFETYIYHTIRVDRRHNFSLFFYYLYISKDYVSLDLIKLSCTVLEFILLLLFSLAYGNKTKTLPFALFAQTVVLVAYNSVMTSQYFIWFLSLLPLIAHNLRINIRSAIILAAFWLISQGLWLFYAYLLEFHGQEIFLVIWFMGILLFMAHIHLLAYFVRVYKPGYDFGIFNRKKLE